MKGSPGRTRQTVRPRATYLIKELERAVRARVDDIVRPLQITTVQYTALSVLARNPGISSAQLARRSFVTAQAANEMVSGLEKRDLIRRAEPDGGRALGIHLTARGERTLARCDEKVDALEATLFRGVTRANEALFRTMLRSCCIAMRESDGKAA